MLFVCINANFRKELFDFKRKICTIAFYKSTQLQQIHNLDKFQKY